MMEIFGGVKMDFILWALLYIAVSFGIAVLTGRLIHAGTGDDHERRGKNGDQSE